MEKARQWTREEYQQLAELWGKHSIPAIAERMNRSENGIRIKAFRMGLGGCLANSEHITYNELIQVLGLKGGYSWTLKKFTEAGLKIRKQRVEKSTFLVVDIDDFWEFAEKNRHMIDFSRFEEYTLGKEPEWVKAKRAEDWKRRMTVKPHNAKWTEAEDKELLRLLRAYRYTYPDIAARLRRSEGAIVRRMRDLGIKERPLKADNHTRWTDEELYTVGEMIKAGSNYESMSAAIGKSTKAIRGKVFTVYLTENLNKVAQLIGTGNFGDNRPDRKLSQRLLMTCEEKAAVKESASKLVSLLTYRIRQHFDDQDNWQRFLCQNWDDVKGCTAGGVNCDGCSDFLRIRPQYCARCGATFYERKENRFCERCRVQRKKQAAHKYMLMQARKHKRES